MYVDESGDCGLPIQGSPTRYFILSGFVLHELRWDNTIEQIIQFRKRMRDAFNIRMRDEIHASGMLSRHNYSLNHLTKNERLTILRFFIQEIASLNEVSIINIIVDKSNKSVGYDVFSNAWGALLQRFENTISHRNFPGPSNADDRGIIFPDHTDDKKLRLLFRKIRKVNFIPNQRQFASGSRNIPIVKVIEDPNMRDSKESYLIQVVDTVAYFLKQYIDPSKYMLKKGGHKYFQRLEPVLCKYASQSDPLGIVRL